MKTPSSGYAWNRRVDKAQIEQSNSVLISIFYFLTFNWCNSDKMLKFLIEIRYTDRKFFQTLQGAFAGSATKFKEFQAMFDDDIERSEVLKKELALCFWGENEQKLALQAEANQYRFASEISSRAAQCKIEIREVVQQAGKVLDIHCITLLVSFSEAQKLSIKSLIR